MNLITSLNEFLDICVRVLQLPILVAALSNAWVCGRSLAWIAGSNPGVCLSLVNDMCCQVEVSASGRSLARGVLPSVCVCVSLSVIKCNNNTLHLQWLRRRGQTKKERKIYNAFILLVCESSLHVKCTPNVLPLSQYFRSYNIRHNLDAIKWCNFANITIKHKQSIRLVTFNVLM